MRELVTQAFVSLVAKPLLHCAGSFLNYKITPEQVVQLMDLEVELEAVVMLGTDSKVMDNFTVGQYLSFPS